MEQAFSMTERQWVAAVTAFYEVFLACMSAATFSASSEQEQVPRLDALAACC